MWISDKWTDYELLDCSGGERLERWGPYLLVRPDPQAIWQTPREHPGWNSPDARYARSPDGGGHWDCGDIPEKWRIGYAGTQSAARGNGSAAPQGPMLSLENDGNAPMRLKLNVSLMNFKHTGVFPEQAANWEFISERIRSAGREISVLNLFAYTGGATLAAASAGAGVCHVDAAKGMVARARENAALSGLQGAPIRWIVDDCVKFVEREIRRGRKYDALVMDPPSYGRGPSGETWKLEDELYRFAVMCGKILIENPLFVLVNSYTAGLSPSALTYIARSAYGGRAESRELGLPVTASGLALPCGASCRVT